MRNLPLLPESATGLAREVDKLAAFGIAVTVFFSVAIAITIIFLAVRYRRRSPEEVGQREHAGMWLEVTWTVIPLCIVLFMFTWGAKIYYTARRPPSDATEYFATAKQWMWKFQHPDGPREINELHVPVGQPIKLTMTSEDVIHSFFVPAFRVKMDVLPGRYTDIWFQPDRTGSFVLFCAEFCGAEHSRMTGRVVVMEAQDYQAWLAGRGGATVGGQTMSGEELFTAKACSTCHRPDSNLTGPYLVGAFGNQVTLASGDTVLVDENYVRESILDPTAKVVKGYNPLMPTYQGQLSEEELVQLILYVKSLADITPPGGEAETSP